MQGQAISNINSICKLNSSLPSNIYLQVLRVETSLGSIILQPRIMGKVTHSEDDLKVELSIYEPPACLTVLWEVCDLIYFLGTKYRGWTIKGTKQMFVEGRKETVLHFSRHNILYQIR